MRYVERFAYSISTGKPELVVYSFGTIQDDPQDTQEFSEQVLEYLEAGEDVYVTMRDLP